MCKEKTSENRYGKPGIKNIRVFLLKYKGKKYHGEAIE
jgi:hypothetical protein